MGCWCSTKKLRSFKSVKYQVKNLGFGKNKTSFFTTHQQKRAFYFREVLFIEEQQIGSGSFADVYLYKNTNDDSLHALKILKDNTASIALIQECQMMKDVESQFIIRIEEFIKIDGQLCIMMEYANQGTLDNFLLSISQQTVKINANQILDIVCDIFSGLDVMHTKKIIHRDLKMDNLLVSNYQIKIADLGVSTYLISKSYAKTKIGNFLYAAQEKLNENESYNSASDIFSAGLIILQMILGLSSFELLKLKINDNYSDQIQDSPKCLRSFIEELLNKNPLKRPTAIHAFNLARKFKYDSEVLTYINERMIGALVQNIQILQNKDNQQAPSQPFFGQQSIQLQPIEIDQGGKIQLEDLQEQQVSIIVEQNPVSVEALAGEVLQNQNNQQASSLPLFGQQSIQQLQPNGIDQGGKILLEDQLVQNSVVLNIESEEQQFPKISEQNPVPVEALEGTFLQNKNNEQAVSLPFFGQQSIQLQPQGIDDKILLVDQLFQKGMQYYWEQNIESAEQLFSTILEQNLVSVEAIAGKLLCGYQYQSWINKNKEYTKDWLQDQLTQIKELNPDHYMYYFCLGVINKDVDSINKCIELRPSMAEAIAYKSYLLVDQKNIQEAIQYGQIALEMSENSVFVLRMVAYVYLEKNQDISEKHYQRSLEINPSQYIVLSNLAGIFQKKDLLDNALECINESLSICPFFEYSILQKINILLKENQFQEIIEYIQNLFLAFGEQQFLFFNLAYSYDALRNFSQALLYYTKNLIYNQNDISTINNMARIYENLKEYEKAREYYQMGIDKKDKGFYINMNKLLKKHLNQAEKGIEYLSQMLKLEFDINDESDCMIKLRALRELKQYEEFLSFSEEAIKKHPSSVGISDQIKTLLRDINNKINLPQQFKLADIIQSYQGINLGTLLGQLKYFKLNKMEGLIVSHILKYYEYSIHQESNCIYYTPNIFENFIDENNLRYLYKGIQQIYENNKDNLYCYVIFICLISLKKLQFSDYMLKEIDLVYKTNQIFKNETNQHSIDYWKIKYKHYELYYCLQWPESNDMKNMFQNYIQFCEGFSHTFKKNCKDYFSLLLQDLNQMITNNDALLQFKQKELNHYRKLLQSVKREAYEIFPYETFNIK